MMDYYLDENNVVDRLVAEWQRYGKIIIAYDFDDTVYDYHKKDRQYNDVITLLKECGLVGAYFIVFTCCGEDDYDKIKDYLSQLDIPYDAINDNLEFVKFKGRKIYYNILLDDRAGLPSAYKCLKKALKIIKQKENEL